MNRSADLVGFGLVILAGSMFGTLGVVSRLAYDLGMTPISLVAWRGLFGFVGVAIIVTIGLRRGRALVRRGDVGGSARFPLLIAMAAAWGLNMALFLAFDRVTVALALLAFYLFPALVTIADVWAGRERLDRAKVIALSLAIGGMVAVVGAGLGGDDSIRFDWLGVGLALLAALIQTIFIVVSRDGYSRIPADQAMGAILGAATLLAVLVALLTGSGADLLLPLADLELLGLSAFAGLFGAAIPSVLFLIGIRRLGGMRAGILMLAEPIVGVSLAAVVLHQTLQPIQGVGAAAILAAAVILQRTAPHGTRPSPVGSAGGAEAALAVDTADELTVEAEPADDEPADAEPADAEPADDEPSLRSAGEP